ncbi:hypothetical protein DNTS_003565, partial [Danionella cerebrum]
MLILASSISRKSVFMGTLLSVCRRRKHRAAASAVCLSSGSVMRSLPTRCQEPSEACLSVSVCLFILKTQVLCKLKVFIQATRPPDHKEQQCLHPTALKKRHLIR